ncbi:hypothetical protein [Tumebacillus lipolyticus]|uniref:Uncharacterized protein n=1 Tax=Tumebacillus lipolyticus TaxID=1280370 RepID=A0ABW4ZTI4_9BACL
MSDPHEAHNSARAERRLSALDDRRSAEIASSPHRCIERIEIAVYTS